MFLEDATHFALYIRYHKKPSQEIRNELCKRFHKFLFSVRFTKYLSSLIRFSQIDFHRSYRKLMDRNQLIFDSMVGDEKEVSVGELLSISVKMGTATKPLKNREEFQDSIEDPHLYIAFSKLTDRQKEIVTLAYAVDISDTEIASLLKVSQQAITKTRSNALGKMRQFFEDRCHGKREG